jgi:hypothetical protein
MIVAPFHAVLSRLCQSKQVPGTAILEHTQLLMLVMSDTFQESTIAFAIATVWEDSSQLGCHRRGVESTAPPPGMKYDDGFLLGVLYCLVMC